MDSLECRSPARCSTCEHFLGAGACALEQELRLLFAPRRSETAALIAPLLARA